MTIQSAPRIAAITPWVGQPSNVWMHRQFSQLSDQMKTIITWEYLNQQQFPLPDTEVRLVPPQFAQPLRGLTRTLDTFRTRRTGGARFGSAFNRWLKDQFVDCGAEAVLGQFGHYAMVAEVACRPLSIPVFAHFHGFDISARLSKKRYQRSLQKQWHDFAGMIVVARYQRDYLINQGIDPQTIALIPCGAPARAISEVVPSIRREHFDSSPGRDQQCRFLFIGRFTEKKDPMSVIQAFGQCHQQHPHTRLRMAGFGPLEEECRDWISRQNSQLADAIEFIGTLTPNQVIEEMASADALVQHSRVSPSGDMEGWPVVIGEAMAASLPIVATRHAGIVDQVDEGSNGLLCDEGDWQQMGEDMIRLAADASLRTRLGEQSLTKILDFDATLQIERLRDFINERTAAVSGLERRRAA
jgi:colanic acid/amylovoran biosynthesis glycosyltransferase